MSQPLSPLVSPSKARHDVARAKDWSYVTTWLSKLYAPRPVPIFERNDDVLKALLELVAANDATDEEAALLHRAQREELERCEEAQQRKSGAAVASTGVGSPASEILAQVEASLDAEGSRSLNELAETSAMLGALETSAPAVGERIMEVTREGFDLEDQLRRVGDLQAYLERELAALKTDLEGLKSSQDEGRTERMQRETTQWTRETKQIGMKLSEYKDRLASLERITVVGPKIEDVRELEGEVLTRQERIKVIEKQLLDYQGLPPDLEAAKGEYERSRKELQSLMKRRDELFETLVTG